MVGGSITVGGGCPYTLCAFTKTGIMAPVFSLNSRWLTASRIEVIAPECAVKEMNSFRSLEKTSSRNSFRRAVRAESDSRSSASQSSSSSVNPGSIGKSSNSLWIADRVLRLSQEWIPRVSRRSYRFPLVSFIRRGMSSDIETA